MRRALPIAVVLAGLLAGDIASAYVLPTEFILRILAEKRRRLNIVDLSIQLTTELESQHAEDRVYLKNPERLRRVRQEEDADTATVEIIREGRGARGPENAIKRVKGRLDILPVLLMPVGESVDHMQVRMTKAVAALGIDTSVTALGRHEDRVCYIIGARAWEKNVSQLWLDKETFLPLRVILVGKGKRSETRWLEFGSSVTGDWYPRVIEVFSNDARVERAEVTKIELNKKVPETLFELP
jgi:outer membrane lipoprotein-sorting protein